MKKFKIKTNTDNCTGCLRCRLACSDFYTKAFNPSAANIEVDLSGADCSISFNEECKGCGVCAEECFYGALQKIKTEAA